MNQELKKQIAVREKEERRMQERRKKINTALRIIHTDRGALMSLKDHPFFRDIV